MFGLEKMLLEFFFYNRTKKLFSLFVIPVNSFKIYFYQFVFQHGEREEEMKKLKNFIVTRTRPKIFWLPRTMNTVTDNKLKESTKVVDSKYLYRPEVLV